MRGVKEVAFRDFNPNEARDNFRPYGLGESACQPLFVRVVEA